jgi:hypothetical protein
MLKERIASQRMGTHFAAFAACAKAFDAVVKRSDKIQSGSFCARHSAEPLCNAPTLQLLEDNQKLALVHIPIQANAGFFEPSDLSAWCWRF